jgi:hypothetical protein
VGKQKEKAAEVMAVKESKCKRSNKQRTGKVLQYFPRNIINNKNINYKNIEIQNT